MGHTLSPGGRGVGRRGGPMDGRGGRLVGGASASSTARPVWDGGHGGGAARTDLQAWALAFTEDARLAACALARGRVSCGARHAADEPRFSRSCRGQHRLPFCSSTSQMHLCPQTETGLPAQMHQLAWTVPKARICLHGLDSWRAAGAWGRGGSRGQSPRHTHTVQLSDTERPGTNVRVGESLSRQTHERLHPRRGKAAGRQPTQPRAHGTASSQPAQHRRRQRPRVRRTSGLNPEEGR